MGSRVAHEPVQFQALEVTNSRLYETSTHPTKRRRVSLPRIDVNHFDSQDTRSALSAGPRRESCHTPIDALAARDGAQDISVTYEGMRFARKNDTALFEAQGAKFIHEPFSFPETQIWLKTKPRQRKSAAISVQETASISRETPSEGETLSLAKHADHIAALIAQKRRANESRSLRERLVLQQRLYRGEEDTKDKIIAASHDELKRKMELSAQGIFEEKAPDGKSLIERGDISVDGRRETDQARPVRDDVNEPASPIELIVRGSESQANNVHIPAVSESIFPRAQDTNQRASLEIEDTDMVVPDRQSTTLATAHAAYRQIQYTTTQSITLTTASAYSQPSNFYVGQLPSNGQISYQAQSAPAVEQFPALQDWTTHMWRALPSTATPVLAQSTIILPSAHTPQQSTSADCAMRASNIHTDAGSEEPTTDSLSHQMNPSDLALGGPGRSERFPPVSRVADTSSSLARAIEDSQVTYPPTTSRSNRNMFTGKAREDMLVGNTNHHPEPERRRNMFSGRQ